MPTLWNALAHVVQSVVAAIAARTTTLTTAAVDTANLEGLLRFTQHVGVVSGTTPTLDGKITHSDTTGGTYTDVTGATFTQVTATDNRQAITVDRKLCKQFVKYVGTIAGTTPSFTFGVLLDALKKSA